MKQIVLIFGLVLSVQMIQAQTCSCAGNPLVSLFDVVDDEPERWKISLGLKYHAINNLVSGSSAVTDDTGRTRTTRSMVLDVQYRAARDFLLLAKTGWIQHFRNVDISEAPADETGGAGDLFLGVNYHPSRSPLGGKTRLSLGAGVKLPTGNSRASTTGVAAEDMQPGTGSWDALAFGYLGHKLGRGGGEVFLSASLRLNGNNSRDYKFGDEIMAIAGGKLDISRWVTITVQSWFRSTAADERFAGEVPNTGGFWLYLSPAVQLHLKEGQYGLKARVDIPVYYDLNGVRQFSTSYQLSVMLFYQF